MNEDLTVKGLTRTTNVFVPGIGAINTNTPIDIKLLKGNTYLFQKMLDNCWIEGTVVNSIDWKTAFYSSIEI